MIAIDEQPLPGHSRIWTSNWVAQDPSEDYGVSYTDDGGLSWKNLLQGVKGGLAYGRTDEYGYEAVENRVHVHDWHATILHLLGLNHERLTFRYAGRDMRLTDVHGNMVRGILG